ncbi:SRPBCC family protein [Hymenobacter ruricola]|uniref:SRPBCC family protein n=1 Tax=Hymenobacter ruricola TaxID=2791023 RepID=A0ABS0I3Y5_9BACT|nr:hypothetical protein [Hymenobacter ruricola]MBF9221443.1 hypothetical protein [Hymenobacter ruricola]
MSTSFASPPAAAAFTKSWLFPAADAARLRAFACDFQKPFWGAPFAVHGNTRTVTLPPYAGSAVITETLLTHHAAGYRYGMQGAKNIEGYLGSFTVEEADRGQVRLIWHIAFTYRRGSKALVEVAKLFARTTPAMSRALKAEFGRPA